MNDPTADRYPTASESSAGGSWASDLDPEYADILTNQTAWFDELAGRKETGGYGLRDVLVHRGLGYQLGGRVADDGRMTDIKLSLWNLPDGCVTSDIKTS